MEPDPGTASAGATPAPSGIITLTSDFGLRDPFVGVMKGRILLRHPSARIVDLTHEVMAHWPAEAGFWLARAYRWFPAGTVHVAVVDPGVGRASATFHGRDIFAPVAAELAAGRVKPVELGAPVTSLVPGWVEEPTLGDGRIAGRVITIDHFGNLLTDIDATLLEGFREPRVHAGGVVLPVRRTYGDCTPGSTLALVNSFGVLEIAVAEGRAADALGLSRGAPVVVTDGVRRN
jgi:S-adenosylmethionine hydrolase